MRILVSRNRIRRLSQAASIAMIAGLAAGCSSDFTRFDYDRNLRAALPRSAEPVDNAAYRYNPYPGDIDTTTTASIPDSTPKPVGPVGAASTEPHQPSYYGPIRRVRDRIAERPRILDQQFRAPSQDTARYEPAGRYDSGVTRAPLPQPEASAPPRLMDRITARPYGRSGAPAPVIDRQPAPISSANRDYSPTVSSASGRPGGWSGVGGTTIRLKEGETLYNLSKRYGVPVNAIKKANDISNASNVHAGQSIIIPTYVYSANAPISAPDNNPNTRAARSSRGLHGQTDGPVSVPRRRPGQLAQPADTIANRASDLPQINLPKPIASQPAVATRAGETNIPDHSTASAGTYTVASGDTLSRIARRNNTTVAALQKANGLSGATIRIGQKLVLPGAGMTAVGVDPIGTGATSPVEGPKPYVKPNLDQAVAASGGASAPDRTGIDTFRWPVKGRIISSFGDKRSTGINDGIDISVPEGTAVKAAENGVVIYSGSELEGFGNLILVRHAEGYVTAYAHNKSINVGKGDKVHRGQIIARSGRTGSARTPMLHFEIRKDSRPVNPVKHLSG